jgi:hypothetical protein
MDPDDAPRSPSDAEDAPEAPEPASPFAPEPEPPRLGIIHLLGWTLCAAVYLSTMRAFLDIAWVRPSEASLAFVVLNSIGVGAALGGLLLWAARRYRRLLFPRHPGEYLLVVMGLQVAIQLSASAVNWATAARDKTGYAGPAISWFAIFSLGLFLGSLISIWAGRRMTIPRWRKFFFALGTIGVLLALIMCGGFYGAYRLQTPLHLAMDVVLLVIILRDRRAGFRYAWTHWVGVATRLWFGAIGLAWTIWSMLFERFAY